MKSDNPIELLSKLFGSYKAEWLQDSLFELYSEPSYFPELTTSRPCVLIGGRGTGKTTVLRSLSYTGQWEINKRQTGQQKTHIQSFKESNYFGFYYRANTPRLSAFKGNDLSTAEWQKLFTHYFNTIFANQLVGFLKWYQENIEPSFEVSGEIINEFCAILALDSCSSLTHIAQALGKASIQIETYINNIGIDDCPRLSSAGSLDRIFTCVANLAEFKNKTFFLIIDEYENFQDEQQQVINTLIKHTSSSYTFKIGVRKMGWRIKNTLNVNEVLTSPADYVLIDIAEKLDDSEFSRFAEEVCNSRIEKLLEIIPNSHRKTVRDLLPSLSLDEEADLLGVQDTARSLRQAVDATNVKKLVDFVSGLSDLQLFVLKYISPDGEAKFLETLLEVQSNPKSWDYKFNEYGYASLFLLNRKNRGVKKYYAGWSVFTQLSAINIRYLLELVEQTLLLQLKKTKTLGDVAISPEIQTEAAQAVGKKNLQELDGLSIYGAKLTKLVLGLGRVFGNLAETSSGHAHEVNQFRIRPAKSLFQMGSEEWLTAKESGAAKILAAAVNHLAVIPFPGNKPKDLGDTKENTFQLHPIFAPYFIFSYRKRRNLMLDEDDILGLIEAPKETINKILKENNRGGAHQPLPSQLSLFSAYFEQ